MQNNIFITSVVMQCLDILCYLKNILQLHLESNFLRTSNAEWHTYFRFSLDLDFHLVKYIWPAVVRVWNCRRECSSRNPWLTFFLFQVYPFVSKACLLKLPVPVLKYFPILLFLFAVAPNFFACPTSQLLVFQFSALICLQDILALALGSVLNDTFLDAAKTYKVSRTYLFFN